MSAPSTSAQQIIAVLESSSAGLKQELCNDNIVNRIKLEQRIGEMEAKIDQLLELVAGSKKSIKTPKVKEDAVAVEPAAAVTTAAKGFPINPRAWFIAQYKQSAEYRAKYSNTASEAHLAADETVTKKPLGKPIRLQAEASSMWTYIVALPDKATMEEIKTGFETAKNEHKSPPSSVSLTTESLDL
jgi:hypothetical protein